MGAAINDGLTTKQRHFAKKLAEAKEVACGCGCGTIIKDTDKYARPKTYISGHNAKLYEGIESGLWAAEKRWRAKNPEKIAEGKKRYYRRRKIRSMRMLGNYCFDCGSEYNGENAAMFEFHHLEPEHKDDMITKMMVNYRWSVVVKELAKCILLCSNCHNLRHSGGW